MGLYIPVMTDLLLFLIRNSINQVEDDNLVKLPPTENSIPHSNKKYTFKGNISLHTNKRTQQTVKSAETITKYFRRDKGTI